VFHSDIKNCKGPPLSKHRAHTVNISARGRIPKDPGPEDGERNSVDVDVNHYTSAMGSVAQIRNRFA
jgi:hypothetical protein